jgi:protein-S-isoprenylcysteine O-methyltransferase Ste14
LLFGAGIVLVTAAAFAMGPRTLSVSPRPRAGAVLITRGIYRVVRHPMYLAVLLCALAAGLAYHNEIKWLLAAALALVLLFKIRYEEHLLRRRFSGYAAYAARTSALLPFIW